MLLFGSITRQKVALIVGIVFSAIAILCLTIIAVISFATLKVTLICVGIFTAILIAFKLWTLLIVVGSLQEVKLEITRQIFCSYGNLVEAVDLFFCPVRPVEAKTDDLGLEYN